MGTENMAQWMIALAVGRSRPWGGLGSHRGVWAGRGSSGSGTRSSDHSGRGSPALDPQDMEGHRGVLVDQSLGDGDGQGEGGRMDQSQAETSGEVGGSHQAWTQGAGAQRMDQDGHMGGEGMAYPCGAGIGR